MASNTELILRKYADAAKEDGRASESRADGLEFYYTEKLMSEYIKTDSDVVEIGCATGHYAARFAGKCRSYLGIDAVPGHIELFNKKIAETGLTNVRAEVGDAVALTALPDGAFDVVMSFGPIYHLPPDERERAVAEAVRVCKPGGVAAFAYICKAGAYMWACRQVKDKYPNANTNDCVLRRGISDDLPGLFFFTMPEEMEETAKRHGLKVIKNAGVDFALHADLINGMDEEMFAAWLELSDFMVGSPSCAGMSNHALMICEK